MGRLKLSSLCKHWIYTWLGNVFILRSMPSILSRSCRRIILVILNILSQSLEHNSVLQLAEGVLYLAKLHINEGQEPTTLCFIAGKTT